MGAFYRDLHAGHGVELLLGQGVESFEGDGQLRAVITAGGRRVECDFAVVGDVANAWHPFFQRRIRVEHWANALNQGPAAARAMLGETVAYDRIPYLFSDQYEAGMEYSGFGTGADETVLRGDPADGEFIAFWLREDRMAAGMNVNVWDVNQHVQALIRSRRPVDRGALGDRDTPLESLVGELAA